MMPRIPNKFAVELVQMLMDYILNKRPLSIQH